MWSHCSRKLPAGVAHYRKLRGARGNGNGVGRGFGGRETGNMVNCEKTCSLADVHMIDCNPTILGLCNIHCVLQGLFHMHLLAK